MKKLIISILLVLTLASTVLLSACSSSTEATTAIRWEEESYTYIVTMQPTTIPEAIEFDNNEFYSVTELVSYGDLDLITPDDVTGTYTTTLTLDNDYWTYTTVLDVYETFDISSSYHYASYVNSFLDNLTTAEYATLVSEITTDSVTLHSVTTTAVTFANNYKQTPASSTREITGYYIGEANQETTSVDIKCTYSDNTATVSGAINGTAVSTTTELADGTIDTAQLALYSRSLNQSTAFETYATATVFEPTTCTTASVSISLTQEYCLLLDIAEDSDYSYASVNCVEILIDSTYTAYRLFNNPNDTMSSAASSTGLNKNTAVMFQSGIYVFQLESYTHLYNDLVYLVS